MDSLMLPNLSFSPSYYYDDNNSLFSPSSRSERLVGACKNCSFSFRIKEGSQTDFCTKGTKTTSF